MRLRLSELQENDEEAKLFRRAAGLPKGWKDIERVLQYQGLPYIPEIICSEVISRHHNDFFARQESWLAGNTIGQAWEETSRVMSKDVTFVWLWRQSDISPMVIYSCCLYRLIGRRISPWTLWPDCHFSLTRRTIATIRFSSLLTNWPG